MNFTIFIKTIVVTIVTVLGISLNTFAQDLIAKQAPIDRTLQMVDSVALQQQIKSEQALYPAYSLYPEWSNKYVASYGNSVSIPESYTIDLTGFAMPTTQTKVTSHFGPRRSRMHNGIDVKVYVGDTIYAAFDGRIRMVKFERRGYGNYVVIRHDNGLETVYGHLSKQLVKEDEYVKAGDPIGLGGNTGRSTGSHLHFETRFLGVPINPALMFDFAKQDIVADSYTFKRKGNNSKAGSNAPQLASDGEIKYYKVRSGDSLSKIASRRQGVSVDKLCQLNRITRKTILRPGQVLRCS